MVRSAWRISQAGPTPTPSVTAEDAARLLQEVEAAGRRQQGRTFAAGFAGTSLGKLVGEAGKKLLDKLGWFGLS
ncbi:hypothetical protein [Nocardia sp. NPDC023988]|uniref:hypothetical protein n=1 Tax=unclassified Nocardia TaxID=2637762 RepID=UPI0033EF3C0F